MTRRSRAPALLLALAVLVVGLAGACDDPQDGNLPPVDPSTEPVVRGTLDSAVTDGSDQFRLVDASDRYYEGMAVRPLQVATITDRSGVAIGAEDLTTGTLVDVWLSGGCAESYPVQCTVAQLQVVDR